MSEVHTRPFKDPVVEIAELAEELCDPRQHSERIYGWTPSRHRKVIKLHTTIQPGLLLQLHEAIHHPAVTDEQPGRSVPASKPPLMLEAFARWFDITTTTNLWISQVRIPHRGSVEGNIRALVGVATTLDIDTRLDLLADLRRWRSWAAVMSGWAIPPLQPHVACPNPECSTMGSLRIIPERKTGFCNQCQHIWDDRDGSINLLAEYIRTETSKTRTKVPIRSTVQGHGGWAERRTA